jgi:polyisoprenoid-binding protein YceI
MRAADVFDAEKHPLVYFISTGFRRVSSGGLFEMAALLTIRGLTVPIQAMVSLISLTGAEAIFKFSGTLSRGAFRLGGPGTTDQEGVDDVVEFLGEIGIRRDA